MAKLIKSKVKNVNQHIQRQVLVSDNKSLFSPELFKLIKKARLKNFFVLIDYVDYGRGFSKWDQVYKDELKSIIDNHEIFHTTK